MGQQLLQAQPYIPAIDNFNAIEAFVRRVYNPEGDPMKDAAITIQPYEYPLRFLNVVSGTPRQDTVQISANADFVLTSPRYRAIVDNADATLVQADATAMLRILLSDTGSQEQLMSEAVDISQYFGQINKAEYSLPYPRIISGRSGLAVQLQNYSGDILTNPIAYALVDLSFVGVLVRGF